MQTPENIYRCSKCKLKYFDNAFGFNRLNARYKTCAKCRLKYKKQSCSSNELVVDPNEAIDDAAVNDNGGLASNLVGLHPVISDNDYNITTIDHKQNDLIEMDIFMINYLLGRPANVDDLDFHEAAKAYEKLVKVQPLLTDRTNILNTLRSYNLNIRIIDDHLEECIQSCPCSNDCLLDLFKHNNDIGVRGISFFNQHVNKHYRESRGIKDLRIIFSPDNIKIFAADIPAIDIFNGFFIKTKNRGKKRCEICLEKDTRTTHNCGNCNKRICPGCYLKMTNTKSCPYCRYTLYDHMQKKIEELDINELIINLRAKI